MNANNISSQTHNAISYSQYTSNLISDLKNDAHYIQGRQLKSIFFGGGTPSLMPSLEIKSIIDYAKSRLSFAENIEITLEANPGTIERGSFNDYLDAGINRISLGAQSFNDQHLKRLGRIHSHAEIITAYNDAREAGIDNINIDLMHGLPAQTLPEALEDLSFAIKLQPEHISWYQLTIEPNTEFYSFPPQLPDENTLAYISDKGHALLKKNGYQQYEVSAYSKIKKHSIHNTNYWNFGDYIGIGAGAHGKITDIKNNMIIRTQKTRLPRDYTHPKKKFMAKKTIVEKKTIAFEFMMNALRMNSNISIDLFHQRTGLEITTIKSQLDLLVNKKLLKVNDTHIKKTQLGHQYLNNILTEFLE